jgi:4-hydroxy-tetrahydrodipicolinate synthase
MPRPLTKDDVVGIFPPLPTPFKENEDLDLPTLRQEVNFMTSLGVTGVCMGGSTGEGHALTAEELGQIIKTAAEEARGRVPVMAGIISTSTREAVRKAIAARDGGAQALMVTPPIYQCVSEDGLVEYYSRIHAASGLPIVVYNVLPGAPVTPSIMRRLAGEPAVSLIGTKESIGGSLETLTELLETLGDRIAVTWAHDWLYFPGMALGAVGSISGMGAILPRHSLALWDAMKRGDFAYCQQLHFVMTGVAREISRSNWPAGTKLAINLQGRKVGPCRSPFGPKTITPEQVERIRAAVVQAEQFDLRAVA